MKALLPYAINLVVAILGGVTKEQWQQALGWVKAAASGPPAIEPGAKPLSKEELNAARKSWVVAKIREMGRGLISVGKAEFLNQLAFYFLKSRGEVQ